MPKQVDATLFFTFYVLQDFSKLSSHIAAFQNELPHIHPTRVFSRGSYPRTQENHLKNKRKEELLVQTN